MFRYLVLCRVYPKSGLDLAKHNKAINLLLNAVETISTEDTDTRDNLKSALLRYKKENEGYVLEVLPISSDTEIADPELEIMPEIRKDYPGAELIRYLKVPEYMGSSGSWSIEDILSGNI